MHYETEVNTSQFVVKKSKVKVTVEWSMLETAVSELVNTMSWKVRISCVTWWHCGRSLLAHARPLTVAQMTTYDPMECRAQPAQPLLYAKSLYRDLSGGQWKLAPGYVQQCTLQSGGLPYCRLLSQTDTQTHRRKIKPGFRHLGFLGETRWKTQQKTCANLNSISVCHASNN